MSNFVEGLLERIEIARKGPAAFFYNQNAVIEIAKYGIACIDPILQENLLVALDGCIIANDNMSQALGCIYHLQNNISSSPLVTSEASVGTESSASKHIDVGVGTDSAAFKPIVRIKTPTGEKKKRAPLKIECRETEREAAIKAANNEAPIVDNHSANNETISVIPQNTERHDTLTNTPPESPIQMPDSVKQLFESSKLGTSSWAKVASKPAVKVEVTPKEELSQDEKPPSLSDVFATYYKTATETHNNVLIAIAVAHEATARYICENNVDEDCIVEKLSDIISDHSNKFSTDSVIIYSDKPGTFAKSSHIFRQQTERNLDHVYQEIENAKLYAIADFIKANPRETYKTAKPKDNNIINAGGLSAIRNLVITFSSTIIDKKSIKNVLIDDVLKPFVEYFEIY